MSAAQIKQADDGILEVSGMLAFNCVTDVLRLSQKFFSSQEQLVFDLGGVEKIDSAGLALLVEWMVMAEKSGQSIAFQKTPKQLLDIARVSGLDEILPIVWLNSYKYKIRYRK
ncbi:MAG: anti-sigma-factor [Cycloclasticus sp. symbiont of Bathymodiolus heckerae]|nr:MAG: anti-sigma-factor [Cycloclasticus sp. symbiont of Bathymodiolus heckerae]